MINFLDGCEAWRMLLMMFDENEETMVFNPMSYLSMRAITVRAARSLSYIAAHSSETGPFNSMFSIIFGLF